MDHFYIFFHSTFWPLEAKPPVSVPCDHGTNVHNNRKTVLAPTILIILADKYRKYGKT